MPVPPVNAEETGYAVLLTRAVDGHPYYAVRDGLPAIFFRHRKAVAFRDELQPHLKQKGRVVKVRVRFTLSAYWGHPDHAPTPLLVAVFHARLQMVRHPAR